jgi:hypothetical protein
MWWRRTLTLEQENARLKKLLAERDLEVEIMKEINEKNVWSAPYLQDELPLTRTVALMYPASREWTAVAVRP